MAPVDTTAVPDGALAFSDLLRHYRQAAGLSQGELAERAGLSERAISDLERGARRVPRRETLRLLAEALDLAPPDQERLAAAVGGRARGDPARATTPDGRRMPAAALPTHLTSFVGREQEVAALRSLLRRSTTRLLTLTGAGGIGKTRLAARLAEGVTEAFPDGVAFVDLSDLPEPGLVPPVVSEALGARPAAGQEPGAAIAERLEGKHVLLVLDNCERVLAIGPWLADLLRACPGLTVLATSRAVMRLQPERVYEVPPLAEPATTRLFIERARFADPGLRQTAAVTTAIAEICRRLEGLPLAIELAAARVRVLPPEALLARLRAGLAVLGGGGEDRPARQRTLEATLDWSYHLLGASEQRLFAHLGAFAGDCDLEAIEGVCAPSGEAAPVLDGLATLVDQSLVRRVDAGLDGTPRFVMLEPVREYAGDRLRASGEAAGVRQAHALHYLALAERAAPHLEGPDQQRWLERLEAEHANLRAALAWAHEAEEAQAGETGLRLAVALRQFWTARGHFTEGRRCISRLLSQHQDVDASLRAKALTGEGILARSQGDFDAAWALLRESKVLCEAIGDQDEGTVVRNSLAFIASRRGDHVTARTLLDEGLTVARARGDTRNTARLLTNHAFLAYTQSEYDTARAALEEALILHQELGDKLETLRALNGLGVVASERGDFTAARSFFDETQMLAREIGDKLHLAGALNNLGEVAIRQGECGLARVHLEESLALKRELGDKQGMAITLANLGRAARYQGDSNTARSFLEEALIASQATGDRRSLIDALINLGRVALDQDDHARARARLAEALTLSSEMGVKLHSANALEGLARLAVIEGEPSRAARLLGATTALRQEIGAPLPVADQQEVDASCAAARTALGAATFAAVWAGGQAMTLKDAVAHALNEATDQPTAGDTPPVMPAGPSGHAPGAAFR